MKIVANGNISPKTIDALRDEGHDVTDLPPSIEDPAVLSLAKALDAVLVTQDLDYSSLLAKSKDSAPSVVSLRLHRAHPPQVTSILVRVLRQYKDVIEEGAVISVSDTGEARVHLLPIGD